MTQTTFRDNGTDLGLLYSSDPHLGGLFTTPDQNDLQNDLLEPCEPCCLYIPETYVSKTLLRYERQSIAEEYNWGYGLEELDCGVPAARSQIVYFHHNHLYERQKTR